MNYTPTAPSRLLFGYSIETVPPAVRPIRGPRSLLNVFVAFLLPTLQLAELKPLLLDQKFFYQHLNRMAAKEILLFSSSNSRDTSLYPSGNSYTLYLSSPVKNIERIDLVNARVPNTIYNLTNGTGVLAVGPSGSPTTVSLNPGFYGVYDMATALTNTGLVTVTYLTFEGKFIFSSASPFGVQVNSTELSNILGIPVTTTAIAATLVPGSGSTWPTYAGQYILTSNNIVNTSIGEIIFLDIDELKTPRHVFTGGLKYDKRQSYVTQLTDGSGPSRAFAPITLDVSSGCMKNFNEGNDYKISVFYPEPINSLQPTPNF
jgi:hypothetical protein